MIYATMFGEDELGRDLGRMEELILHIQTPQIRLFSMGSPGNEWASPSFNVDVRPDGVWTHTGYTAYHGRLTLRGKAAKWVWDRKNEWASPPFNIYVRPDGSNETLVVAGVYVASYQFYYSDEPFINGAQIVCRRADEKLKEYVDRVSYGDRGYQWDIHLIDPDITTYTPGFTTREAL